MANESKQIREAARVVRVLLKKDGHDLRVKDVIPMIENESLDDLVALTQRVSQSVTESVTAAQETIAPDGSRRSAIANFCVQNSDLVNSNPTIKDGLLHLYSMGRYNKEQRAELRQKLVDMIDPTTDSTEEEAQPTTQFNF